MSPSTRRAWIEIRTYRQNNRKRFVALHPEGVDRNYQFAPLLRISKVALHPEGVDRNCSRSSSTSCSRVALHPEGVDRN